MCTRLSKRQRSGSPNSTGSPCHQCSFVVLNHSYPPPLHELLSRLVRVLASPLVLLRPVLRFLPKHLPVRLAIGIKAVMFTPSPSGFQFGPGDVPVRTAFPQHSTQVLPKLFDGRSAKKPVAVINFEYNETRFEDNDKPDHRIVLGVSVLGDVEVLLNLASRIG